MTRHTGGGETRTAQPMTHLAAELRRVGRRLVAGGLVHSCVGNVSGRVGDRVLVSTSGVMLDELTDSTLVELSLDDHEIPSRASSDAWLHCAIYRGTQAGAVVHTHSAYAVAESLLSGEPVLHSRDIESAHVLRGIPVVAASEDPEDYAARCVVALRIHRAIIVRGHGVIAIGATTEEACAMASFAEHACRIRYLCRGPGGVIPPVETVTDRESSHRGEQSKPRDT